MHMYNNIKIHTCMCGCIYVTRFAKRSLIHTSDFAILMNYRLRYYIKNFTHISVMIGQSSYKILKLFLNHKLSYISLKLKNWMCVMCKTPFRKSSHV